MRQIWAVLDEELDEPVRSTFQAHLAKCPPCHERFRFESVLRIHVRQCCQEPTPELVRRRLRRLLSGLGDT
jgi:mycothiol system anti-sigma-R factor